MWNQTKCVSCGWSRAAAVRTNIPSSGPPAASQAGSDPAAWCSEGCGAQWSNRHIQGRVSTHAAEGGKKKREHKNHIYIHFQSRAEPCRVVQVQSAIHSAPLRSKNYAGACLGSQAADATLYLFIFTHMTYQHIKCNNNVKKWKWGLWPLDMFKGHTCHFFLVWLLCKTHVFLWHSQQGLRTALLSSQSFC